MKLKVWQIVFFVGSLFFFVYPLAAQKRPATATAPKVRSIIVATEPSAAVWLDELRRGTTDESGKLTIDKVSAGTKRLRVRAKGFAGKTVAVLPTQKQVKVALTLTDDKAVLTFQNAEEAREKAKNEADKQKAVELYRQALELRPKFAEAHLGLARVLESLHEIDDALEQLAAAQKERLNYAEAAAVEARIYRENLDYEKAVEAANRAVRAGKGFQPEAYTVLGLTYQDQENYAAAAKAFKQAILQLSDTEPTLYQLLGETYEKLQNTKEAIKAYEKFIEIAPQNPQVSSIRSIIEQLKKQGNEPPLPF